MARTHAARRPGAGASVFSARGTRGIPVLPPAPPCQGKQPLPGPVCLPWPQPQRASAAAARPGAAGTFAPRPGSPRGRHPDAPPTPPGAAQESLADPSRSCPGRGLQAALQGAPRCAHGDSPGLRHAAGPADATALLGLDPDASGKFPSPPPAQAQHPGTPPRPPEPGLSCGPVADTALEASSTAWCLGFPQLVSPRLAQDARGTP